jgi:arsenate reductase-like glutaredoxin family protein
MQTQVLGLSVDSEPSLKAWAESLGGITYPLLSDFYPHGRVAEMYGVLRPEGYTERAIFVIDRQGIIRYVDVHDIDTQPDNDELLRVIAKMDPTVATTYEKQQVEAMSSVEPDADVVLYCTPWCQDCPQARQYFKEQHVPYVEVDISRDRAAAARVRGWTGGDEATPTINIRGQVFVTFDQAKVEAALKEKI